MNGMNNQHPNDTFYDQTSSRSPGLYRHQQQVLHRQPSRHFDAYGPMPAGLYTQDDRGLGYEANRFDRMNGPVQGNGYGYDLPQAQTWNPNAFSTNNNFSPFTAATSRMKPPARGRSALPSSWMDTQHVNSSAPYGSIGPSPLGLPQIRPEQYSNDPDEELIPTAIVIKNIPFAVKKEQLVDLMTQMNLPLPYAFNYHFDNGVFRGLAFANFTSPDETAQVIDNLNHYEIQNRKLRVEYKKMLPLQERERIEREKRERRGQLEEQHRPIGAPPLQNQQSISSMSSHRPPNTPSPIGTRNNEMLDLDLNDPQTLNYYTQLMLFKEDRARDMHIFPPTLSNAQRRIVHTLAHQLNLAHVSRGEGEQRQVHIFRANQVPQGISPPLPQNTSALARSSEPGLYNSTLRGQQSSGLLGIPDSPSGFGAQTNLRAAKSVADLRSFTPSPAHSTSSFPPNLQSNIPRFQEYGNGSGASATPTLTPTVSGSALGGGGYRDDGLINGLGNLSLSNPTGSPQRLRTAFSWDQNHQQPTTGPPSAGAIGSNRSFSMNFDNSSQDRGVPMRQPRGPSERGPPAFSRGRQGGHQNRGSDELRDQSSQVAIIVE